MTLNIIRLPRFQTTAVWTESGLRPDQHSDWLNCDPNPLSSPHANRTEFVFTSLFDSSVKTNKFRAVYIWEVLVNKSNINPQRALIFLEERLFDAVKSPAPPNINKLCILFIQWGQSWSFLCFFASYFLCSYCICIPSFNQNHIAPFFSIYLIFYYFPGIMHIIYSTSCCLNLYDFLSLVDRKTTSE